MIFRLLRKLRSFEEQARLRRLWSKLPRWSLADVNPNYELTFDVLGIRNKRPLFCHFCETEMVIRYSCLDWSSEMGNLNTHIDLAFKCPNCDWWTPFGVPVPPQYFLWLMGHRNRLGVGRLYAPVDVWRENKVVEERLRSWGYF